MTTKLPNNQYAIEPELKKAAMREFYLAVAKTKTANQAANLLRDVLTYEEVEEAGRRFEVARLLDRGKTFRDISSRTKMSTATIARINYWLHHGTGGYRLALGRLSGGRKTKA